MQGVIVKVGEDQGIILGDDGGRYAYTSIEWRSEDVEPEVGMRIDFDVRGSDAANIYPIPDASPTPPVQPPASAPPPPTGGSPPAQPGATPSADERFKETLGGLHTKLDDRYQPIKERIGNYGVIGVGVAVLIVSVVIRFDILEGLLDLVAVLGILAGLVMTAVGVFMLGRDEGWWNQLSSQVGSTPPPPGGPPGGIVGPPQYPAAPAASAAYQDAPPSPVDAPGGTVGPPQYPASPAAYQSTETPVIEDAPGETVGPVQDQAVPADYGSVPPSPVDAPADAPAPQYPASPADYGSVPPSSVDAPGETVGPPQYPASPAAPAAYQSAGPVQPSQPQHVPFRQVPVVMLALAILPAILLILTVLPTKVEFSGDWGFSRDWGWEFLLLDWDHFRESLSQGWYVLAIVGALSLGVANFLYRQFNQSDRHRPEETEAFNDRLDLFLSASVLICALTLLLTLLRLLEWLDIALLGYVWAELFLCGLAILSMAGYLVFLVANKPTRSRFGNINILTFVSFKGRIGRPTFLLTTALMHFQQLIGITAALHTLETFAPSPFDKFLTLPYSSFESIEINSSLISWIMSTLVGNLFIVGGVPDYIDYTEPTFLLSIILGILIFYVWLALCVKRYHDLDKSGWWVLVSFIPIAGPIWILVQLGFMKGTPGYNRHDPPVQQAVPGVPGYMDFPAELPPDPSLAGRAMKACPYCGQAILYEALKCRYCYSDIPPEVDSS